MKNFCIISIICILIGCNNAVDKKITYNDPLQISVKKGENMSIGDEQYLLCHNEWRHTESIL